jgi:hypothetical protein
LSKEMEGYDAGDFRVTLFNMSELDGPSKYQVRMFQRRLGIWFGYGERRHFDNYEDAKRVFKSLAAIKVAEQALGLNKTP